MDLYKKEILLENKIYSFRSLIPNIRNSNPIRTIKQITPPLRKAIVAAPQSAKYIPAPIGTITKISPSKSSVHLFIVIIQGGLYLKSFWEIFSIHRKDDEKEIFINGF